MAEMMRRFVGQVAIVTGGASGIGAATVRRLGQEGASVVIADIDTDSAAALVEDLRSTGIEAHFRRCDVGELEQVEACVGYAVADHGGLDIIMNNAMWSAGGFVHKIDPAGWDRSLQIMLTAVFYGCRAAIPAMLERGGGSIVNTASVEAFGGEIQGSVYSAAKAGVVNFTRNVAIEYGRQGIRANAICPGVVDTPLAAQFEKTAPNSREQIADLHAIGRLIRPDEIAGVVAFLCSDDASAVTGHPMVIDGGMTSILNISGRTPYEPPS